MIYTFGYLGQSFAALQAWLVAHDDAALWDIRHAPNSRQPGWSGRALRAALGSRYVHCWELGNRNYRGGPIEIVDLNQGIDAVLGVALYGHPVVLTCCCREYSTCHRHVVAEELRRRGHVVEELRLGEVGA